MSLDFEPFWDKQLDELRVKLLNDLQQETSDFDEKDIAQALSEVLSEQAQRARRGTLVVHVFEIER